MNRSEARDYMVGTIKAVLSNYPDLAGEASAAISEGVNAAICDLRNELSDARLGLAVSLALLPPNRVNDEARATLSAMVTRAIGNPACEAERRFLATQTQESGQ